MRSSTLGRKIISFSLSPDIAKEIEKTAKKEKRSISEILREAWRLYMDEKKWQRIQDYGRKKAAELGYTEADVERLIDEYRSGK